MRVMTMIHSFDVTNLHVRQVITPDGIGELVFKDANDPSYFYVKIRIGDRKIADFKKYSASELQEIEGGKNG